MNDSAHDSENQATLAVDRKSTACGLFELLRRGEGICLGKFALSMSSLFLNTELVVQSSLEVKRKPETDA